jgi:arginine exporter protein ArgO
MTMLAFILGALVSSLLWFMALTAISARRADHDALMTERIEAMRRLIHRYDEDDCA